jgi:hypothetical protein
MTAQDSGRFDLPSCAVIFYANELVFYITGDALFYQRQFRQYTINIT